MSWYEMHNVIDAGHHSMWIDNECGDTIARGEGPTFLIALDNLKQALPPTRHPDWINPLDEREEDYS